MPVVAVDRSPVGLNVDLVGVTNDEGARDAVLHLATLGRRRIALIGGPPSANVAVEREQGYREALDQASLSYVPALVVRADFREEGGYQAMVSLLNRPVLPDAVFVANNLMAMGALRAMADASLRVPDDVALVSFDDIPWGTRVSPPLTAVAQPTYDLGVSAARILLDRIREPHRPIRRVALQTTLVVRRSCGALVPEG